MEKKIMKSDKNYDVQEFLRELRKCISRRDEGLRLLVLYLLYLRNRYDSENVMSVSELVDKRFPNKHTGLEYTLRDIVAEDLWDKVRSQIPSVSDEVLETVLLDTTGEYFTPGGNVMRGTEEMPDTLSDLVIRLLDIKSGDKVYDMFGGAGDFLVKAVSAQPSASYYGRGKSSLRNHFLEIRKDILEKNYEHIRIHTKGVGWRRGNDDRKFDKIFGRYPWMVDLTEHARETDTIYDIAEKEIPGILGRHASDWLYNFAMVSQLKESGKAIGIMTNGSTWNQVSGCKNARKYFLEHGFIEAVIALPSGMFKEQSSLIVLSRGNEKVKMIDASDLHVGRNRKVTMTPENIDDILAAYENDGERSVSVSIEEILSGKEIAVHPGRYLKKTAPVKDGVQLGTVLKAVRRGANLPSSAMDRLMTDTPTDCRYVLVKNITDGMIDENLPYITGLDKETERFIAPRHSVILSKIGTPFKCAVVDASEPKLLINGNMYILEVDETKANPYYLKLLFESAYGTSLLERISIGSKFPTFTKSALEELIIPLPSLKEQDRMAERYLALQNEIRRCKAKLDDAIKKKSRIFEDMQS